MRILALSGRPPSSLGGSERALARLCWRWAERCEVDVLAARPESGEVAAAPGPSWPFAERPVPHGLTLHEAPLDEEGRALARRLRALVAERRPAVVYLTDKIGFKRPRLGEALLDLAAHTPVVFKESTCGKLLKILAAQPQARRWEQALAAVVCIARQIRADFDRSGRFAGRLHLIPNGVDTQRFRPLGDSGARAELRRRLELPAEAPVLLFSGRFAEKKNLDVIYGAWLDLERRRGDFGTLVLMGAPHKHYDRGILRLIREDLAHVRIIGPLTTEEEQLPWYQAADFYLAPTSREGLSNAFLEAAACGLFPIVSRASGYPDLITVAQAGILVEERNTSEVIAALEAVLARPDHFRRLGHDHTRAAVTAGFELGAVADRYLALFASLAR